ncbi:protocadherin-1-like isoform X1 [Haliotis asinina]|uniref:protocadherin-1-like isoform X1 n=1 Tax=Haliotis asinina TaxID=109174 RepID=UPI00353217A3
MVSMATLIPLAVLLPALCPAQEIVLSYKLKEEQSANTYVGNVARDSYLYGNVTESVFQRLKFNFFSQGNPSSRLFAIDEKSSTIRTAQVIDRESPDVCEGKPECILNLDIGVYIRDVSKNRYDLYKLMQAKVDLVDINDNKPEFPQGSVSLSLPESVPVNHMLLASGAIDKDTGANNSIKSYEIIPANGMFDLKVQHNFGTSDLGIVVKHSLDRETKDFFQVTIVAKDGGYPQRTGSVLINITVTDVNDNSPAFIESSYNVTVIENGTLNATILQLSAVDQDKGENGEISYHLSSRASDKVRKALAIDPTSGKVYTIGDIDYEENKQFQFMVEARDKGSPSRSSLVPVVINVIDKNDNKPEININLSPEGSDISEGAETGRFIAHVSVTDRDDGKNGDFTCDMNDAHFSLDKFNANVNNVYKITLKEKLDHESSPTHNVTITCKDKGDNPQTNSTSFLVRVLDENDNAPRFNNVPIIGQIVENNKLGMEILQITAKDWDSKENGRVTYSLDSDAGSLFTINPETGSLLATAPYDRETVSKYEFGVIATDHGSPPKSSTAKVLIRILDQNDKPPRFTVPVFRGYILENQPIRTPVLNLTATDEDEKPSMKFAFGPNSEVNKWFAIDENTGRITSKRSFDRETQKKYNFTVIVQDPMITSFHDTANVTIHVRDDNDNIPIITYPTKSNKTVRIPYGTKVGTIVTKVTAKDTDDIDIQFIRLTFSIISGNKGSLFNINRMNGELAVSRVMKSSDLGFHGLKVAVHDRGTNSKSATATLDIFVVDVNGTARSEGHSEVLEKNMMIVIILIAVTVILAIAIFATICMIRRIDRERQQRRSAMIKTDEDKTLTAISNRDSFLVIAKDSNENDDTKLKRNKKEVSFTFEDDRDIHNMSNSSGHASMSTFGVPAPTEHSQSNSQEVNLMMTPIPSLVEKQNNMNSPGAHEPSNIPVQNNIPVTPHPTDKTWIQNMNESEARHLMEILKKPDDIMSETSGETGTSDSGRGGSDEDINSNRSATHDIDDPRILHPAHFIGADRFARFNDGRTSELSRSSHRNGSRGHVVSPMPSGTGKRIREESLKYGRSHDLPQSYTASPCHFEHFPSHNKTKDSHKLQNDGYHRMDLSSFPPRQTDFYSSGSWRADSMSYRDDDDRTTTSGSYTINPDELRHDIDEVFYTEQDIVV